MKTEALLKLQYGMCVVSSKLEDNINGQIANTVFQVSSNPPLVAVSINKLNLTHEFIEKSNVFTVSVLSVETPLSLIGLFGYKTGREIKKFEDVNYKIGKTGAPILLESTVAYIEAEVINKVDVGTHTIFIGKVVETEYISEGEAMTYEYYRKVKKGKAPEKAPTYIAEKKEEGGNKMDKYVCKICGYIYDPEKGDPENGIVGGTSFEDLPEDWVCPVCRAGKNEFEKEEK